MCRFLTNGFSFPCKHSEFQSPSPLASHGDPYQPPAAAARIPLGLGRRGLFRARPSTKAAFRKAVCIRHRVVSWPARAPCPRGCRPCRGAGRSHRAPCWAPLPAPEMLLCREFCSFLAHLPTSPGSFLLFLGPYRSSLHPLAWQYQRVQLAGRSVIVKLFRLLPTLALVASGWASPPGALLGDTSVSHSRGRILVQRCGSLGLRSPRASQAPGAASGSACAWAERVQSRFSPGGAA